MPTAPHTPIDKHSQKTKMRKVGVSQPVCGMCHDFCFYQISSRQHKSTFVVSYRALQWSAHEQVSALSFEASLVPIRRRGRDKRHDWPERKIRTEDLELVARDSLRFPRLHNHARGQKNRNDMKHHETLMKYRLHIFVCVAKIFRSLQSVVVFHAILGV